MALSTLLGVFCFFFCFLGYVSPLRCSLLLLRGSIPKRICRFFCRATIYHTENLLTLARSDFSSLLSQLTARKYVTEQHYYLLGIYAFCARVGKDGLCWFSLLYHGACVCVLYDSIRWEGSWLKLLQHGVFAGRDYHDDIQRLEI